MRPDDGALMIEEMLQNKINAKKKSLDIPDSFPNNKSIIPSKFQDGDDFIKFLRKFNVLLSLQLFFSLEAIQREKRRSLRNFVEMYLETQQELLILLQDMYDSLDDKSRTLVMEYTDIPLLEKEIDNSGILAYSHWNNESSLTDKDMLDVVEQVGDSVKDPIKKVFGGVLDKGGKWWAKRKGKEYPEKFSVKYQGKINSGFKYLDEFANIAMRIASGGS